MTFEEWFEQERQAGRLYCADEDVARTAWEASQRAPQPASTYHDSRIFEAVRQRFAKRS
jgi:hypothetical protein